VKIVVCLNLRAKFRNGNYPLARIEKLMAAFSFTADKLPGSNCFWLNDVQAVKNRVKLESKAPSWMQGLKVLVQARTAIKARRRKSQSPGLSPRSGRWRRVDQAGSHEARKRWAKGFHPCWS
jgi:hypothetical protein